jgi:antitoxin ParD1/3/4
MNISLTPHYEDLLKGCVDSGRYNNVSEVLREALRVWEHQHTYQEWLRREAREGYQDVLDGKMVPVSSEEEFLKVVRGKRN